MDTSLRLKLRLGKQISTDFRHLNFRSQSMSTGIYLWLENNDFVSKMDR
jgi:hypothetical protein